MLINEILNEAGNLGNGTLANGIQKMLDGYQHGRDSVRDTCYNWVGEFLRTHPNYDHDPNTIVRFWGLKREPLDRSLVVHGDAIAPAQHDHIEDWKVRPLPDDPGTVLISNYKDADYAKVQLIVQYRWDDLKRHFLAP